MVAQWVRDHIAAGVIFVTQSGGYDWGWMRTEWGIVMPASEQLDDTSAMATMVDENRLTYNLDDLCAWQGIPGKDMSLLTEACIAYGFDPKKARAHIHDLPARYAGPYGEADPRDARSQ